MKLVIHIDRVVLEGVTLDAGQRHKLRQHLEDQLGRRLLGRALIPEVAGGAAVPVLTATPVIFDSESHGPPGTTARLASGVAASVATTLAGGSP